MIKKPTVKKGLYYTGSKHKVIEEIKILYGTTAQTRRYNDSRL